MTFPIYNISVQEKGYRIKNSTLAHTIETPAGLLYFGGNNGFNVIDHNRLTSVGRKPKVSIESISVMNQRKIPPLQGKF